MFNDKFKNKYDEKGIGIYLHWNGGRDSIEAFLTYCKIKGYRSPNADNYGWARLTQVIANFFGGTDSVGVDICDNLDCDNGDNGVYLIKNWEIVDRVFNNSKNVRQVGTLREFVYDLDSNMPEYDQLTYKKIDAYFNRRKNKTLNETKPFESGMI